MSEAPSLDTDSTASEVATPAMSRWLASLERYAETSRAEAREAIDQLKALLPDWRLPQVGSTVAWALLILIGLALVIHLLAASLMAEQLAGIDAANPREAITGDLQFDAQHAAIIGNHKGRMALHRERRLIRDVYGNDVRDARLATADRVVLLHDDGRVSVVARGLRTDERNILGAIETWWRDSVVRPLGDAQPGFLTAVMQVDPWLDAGDHVPHKLGVTRSCAGCPAFVSLSGGAKVTGPFWWEESGGTRQLVVMSPIFVSSRRAGCPLAAKPCSDTLLQTSPPRIPRWLPYLLAKGGARVPTSSEWSVLADLVAADRRIGITDLDRETPEYVCDGPALRGCLIVGGPSDRKVVSAGFRFIRGSAQ